MDFKRTLGQSKAAIDKEIGWCFDKAVADAEKSDPLMAEALRHTKKIALAGGKRIRGALLYWGYRGAGGRDKKKIIKAAAAIELVHLFLLIHDDIMDRGNLRHGQKTLHIMFAGKKRKGLSEDEARHFGDSMAIIAGDMLYALAVKILAEAGFDAKATAKAVAHLSSVVETTIIGQSQDMAIAQKSSAQESDVLSMYRHKTARYTFEGPLQLGAILAGHGDKKTLDPLSRYAMPLGIAFQIQDDILGVFGSEKKMGKSVASDIEEGKQSLVVVKAHSLSTSQQKKKLNAILGKKDLTRKEIREFQDIIVSTGALAYATDMAAGLLAKGKNEIKKAVILPEAKNFLLGLVEYLEKREI